MAKFTVRVELHGSHDESDYETLHEEMEKKGFVRTIDGKGITYALPTAEYNKKGNFTTEQVLAFAKKASKKTGKSFSVLVTKADGRR